MSASFALRSNALFLVAATQVTLLALFTAGCDQGIVAQPPPPPVKRAPPRTAAEKIFDRVVETYQHADRYQDDGRLVVRYILDGEAFEETSDFSLAVAGPNRMRMRAYDALVVCDGRNFRAILDEAPGEVLSFPAPDELSPATVYRDPVLGKALNHIVGSVPLSLFLDPEPLPAFLYNSQSPQLDEPDKIGADKCYRLRIGRREGPLVLWIDEQTFVVRRVEYPADAYRRMVEPEPGAVTSMTITAELENARLDPPLDDSLFHLDMPQNAELVTWFDVVNIGSRLPKFKLRALDGKLLTRDSLAEKIVVLKFWQSKDLVRFYDDLASLDEVQKRYQDRDSVVFLAVSADSDEVSDEELQAAFDQAKLSLPIARIDAEVSFRSFGLKYVPTTVILGRGAVLQEYEFGNYPDQAIELPRKLDTLLAGDDLFLEPPKKPQNYVYFSGVSFQAPQQPEEEQQQPAAGEAELAPPSEPDLLVKKPLWASKELKQPGNMLAVHDEASHDRVFVIEGKSSVAEIDAQGNVIDKHHLDLPKGDVITFLRTASDAAGKRYYLAATPGAKQVCLFDANWKRVLCYPKSRDSATISDALLSDINGDGTLEMLVGYFGQVGVHCVALDGEWVWRNRIAQNVLRLDVTVPDRRGQRQVLAAEGLLLLPIDATGNERTPLVLNDAGPRLIFSTDLDRDGSSEWCVIAWKSPAPGKVATDVAIGISPRGDELWRYALPRGVPQHIAFEFVTSGNLLSPNVAQWVIAGVDGSILVLAADGTLIDRFNYGAAHSGMAIANFDGQPALILASDNGIEAWQLELPRRSQTSGP